MFNLLSDPLLTVTGGRAVSLPELFASLAKREVREFPFLRPHQRPSWHMFLVQIGALAVWGAGWKELPDDPARWREALRKLTDAFPDEEPWQLVVEDWARPAFLQPPDPGDLKWSPADTPDELDLLILSKNHDLKRGTLQQASAEHWVYLLISVQTTVGFFGQKKYGIARMNGGFANRPLLGLVPAPGGTQSIDPSQWWIRDVQALIEIRREPPTSFVGTVGGPSLLWCLVWPEEDQLDLQKLDPWFVEVARRIRLEIPGESIRAQYTGSKKARIDAKASQGNTGDPWTPISKKDGAALTIGPAGFSYRKLHELLFSGDWDLPPLACAAPHEKSDMLLVAQGLTRGQGKTEGFHSRVVPLPGTVLTLLSQPALAEFSKAQIDEIRGMADSLRYAVALAAAGGDRDKLNALRGQGKLWTSPYYSQAEPARRRFEQHADRLFFPSLWKRYEAGGGTDPEAPTDAKRAFLTDLYRSAERELEQALASIAYRGVSRHRAETRARAAFRNRIRHSHPILFTQGDSRAV